MDPTAVIISQFLGLVRRTRFTKGNPEQHASIVQNVDGLLRDCLRPRPSTAHTNYLGRANASDAPNSLPVSYQFLFESPDGGREMIWRQGGAIWGKTNPGLLSGGAPVGVELDAGLSATSYPFRWGTGTDNAAGMSAAVLRGRAMMVNGRDAPLIRDKDGVARMGLMRPRTLTGGVPLPATPNVIFMSGANGADTALAKGTIAWAYTWYDAKRRVESNPTPIFTYDQSTVSFSTITPTSYIGLFTMNIDATPWGTPGGRRPPRATHARIYRTMTGDNVLKRTAEVKLPATGIVTWTVGALGGASAVDVATYGDASLLLAPDLEYDHDPPLLLAGIIVAGNVAYGWQDWREAYLPGRLALTAQAARATTTAGAGHVVTITPTATSGKIQECHIGMTIEFPTGTGKPYPIYDVDEENQTIRIGVPIDQPVLLNTPGLDAGDSGLTNVDFVLRAKTGQLWFSHPNEPEYWRQSTGDDSRADYYSLNEDDGAAIRSALAVRDGLLVWKPRSTWFIRREFTPVEARPIEVSTTIGTDSLHGPCLVRGAARFPFAGVIYQSDGGAPTPVSVEAMGPAFFGAITHSHHVERERYTIHFSGTEAYVNFYDLAPYGWSRWTWARAASLDRTMTTGCYAPDADGNFRLFLSDSVGFTWVLYPEGIDGVGVADGHAATTDTLFRARSTTTADGSAAGRIKDSAQVFPDHLTTAGIVLEDPLRVRTPSGDYLRGYVTGRLGADEITTSITQVIPQGSTYEMGCVHWFYQPHHIRLGGAAHIEHGVGVVYTPQSWGVGDESRHRHLLYLEHYLLDRSGSGQVEALTAYPIAQSRGGYPDEGMGEFDDVAGPHITVDAELSRALVNYAATPITLTTPTTLASTWQNPGIAAVDNGVTWELGDVATFVAVRVGEEGTALKGEVLELRIPVTASEDEWGLP